MDSGERFLAEPALEYVDIVAGRGESVAYGIDMSGPLSENETGPAGVECLHDVCADLSGASLRVRARRPLRIALRGYVRGGQAEISIIRRQWSLAPHSSGLFRARTLMLSWKPREANA